MALEYRTSDGDTVDLICWRHYGRTDGATEAVLAANVGLSDLGPRLPAGYTITLPDLAPAQTTTEVRLWD